MPAELPQVVKTAERLLADIEEAVRRFPRYHKYAIGSDLRAQARTVAVLALKAWREQHSKHRAIGQLSDAIDELKLLLQTAQRIKAFGSFAQFEAVARLAADVGRQVGGWRKHLKGQNAAPAAPQRAQILSAHPALGANP